MAWPVYIDDDDDGSEAVSANDVSSTSNVNMQGADRRLNAGSYLVQNIHIGREGVLNPYLNRIQNVRRYSLGDAYQHYRPPVSSTDHISQRHSLPSFQINQNMRHSCRFNLNRRTSLDSSDIYMSRFCHCEFPVNFHENSTNILNPSGQFVNESTRSVNNGRRKLSLNQSLLFRSQHSVAEWNIQQCTSVIRPEYFIKFLEDQVEQNGLQLPESLSKNSITWSEVPQSLCYLIDTFSVSLEREMVLGLARRVQFPLSFQSFVIMLDGIEMERLTNIDTLSPESIVTIFFFCGDLAVRALRANDEVTFRDIVSWTQCYLRRLNVLVPPSKKPSYKIAITACILGIITIFALMKHS